MSVGLAIANARSSLILPGHCDRQPVRRRADRRRKHLTVRKHSTQKAHTLPPGIVDLGVFSVDKAACIAGGSRGGH
ncbi:MAG: hypothetical protein IPI83_11710 [Sphingomonadales bacterium]|nr:hypothetical protein [Sphingomonadales bacterium]